MYPDNNATLLLPIYIVDPCSQTNIFIGPFADYPMKTYLDVMYSIGDK